MTLGEFVFGYREKHDLTIREFAALTGLSPQYILCIERDTNNYGKRLSPSLDTYKAVAKACGLDIFGLLHILEGRENT